MCLEKRAFYRAISGLHTSINIHLSAQYLLSGNVHKYVNTRYWKINFNIYCYKQIRDQHF